MIVHGASDGCSVSIRDLFATVPRHDGHAFATDLAARTSLPRS